MFRVVLVCLTVCLGCLAVVFSGYDLVVVDVSGGLGWITWMGVVGGLLMVRDGGLSLVWVTFFGVLMVVSEAAGVGRGLLRFLRGRFR